VPIRRGYGPRPHHGDHFPHRPGFSVGGSYTHFETIHMDGTHFLRRGSRLTQPSGDVQRIVKTSFGRMVRCWIPKIFLTNPSTEPSTFFTSDVGDGRRLRGHVAHGFWLFTTHDRK
jgi:hypothetical protein